MLVQKAIIFFIIVSLAVAMAIPATALRVNDGSARTSDTIHTQSSRVVFLEHYMVANGTVVDGEAPFRSVNFPSYWYNENTGQLKGKIGFPINDSLVMIFGDVLTLQGNFGAGTGNKLFGIYSLPAYAGEAVIYSVDMNGNIVMDINDNMVILKPGTAYKYTQNETLEEDNAIVEVEYTLTYVNHGFIDKKDVGESLVTSG